MSDCFSCSVDAAGSGAPDRERVWLTPRWRVAHATGSRLLGWLVLLPRRHVEGLHELDAEEAAELGELLRSVSAALVRETGAVKTYAVLFAEADGYSHLHVHLVPRAPDLPDELQGPRIFGYLGAPPQDEVPPAERDAVARRLRVALEGGSVRGA